MWPLFLKILRNGKKCYPDTVTDEDRVENELAGACQNAATSVGT